MAPRIVVVLDSNLPNPPAIFHRADTPAPRSPTTATPVTGSTIGAALLWFQAMDQALVAAECHGMVLCCGNFTCQTTRATISAEALLALVLFAKL